MTNALAGLGKNSIRTKGLTKIFGKNNFITKALDPSHKDHFDPLGLFKKPTPQAAPEAPVAAPADPNIGIDVRRSVRRRAAAGGLGSTVLAGDQGPATGQTKVLLGG